MRNVMLGLMFFGVLGVGTAMAGEKCPYEQKMVYDRSGRVVKTGPEAQCCVMKTGKGKTCPFGHKAGDFGSATEQSAPPCH